MEALTPGMAYDPAERIGLGVFVGRVTGKGVEQGQENKTCAKDEYQSTVAGIIEINNGEPPLDNSAGPQPAPFTHGADNYQHETDEDNNRKNGKNDNVRIGFGMRRQHRDNRKKDHEADIEQEDYRTRKGERVIERRRKDPFHTHISPL
jgi:hypothetical protein